MFKIYLSGGMKNISFEKQSEYREYIQKTLESFGNCKVFNPIKYFNYQIQKHKTEKQVFLFELDNVRKSDLVIVNFNNPSSLGTMAEITVAYEHRIPIIGIRENNEELHAWHIEMCDVIFESVDEAIDYIKVYYLS